MFANSVVLFAFVCVVRSSVVINVYEDGEYKASHSLQDSCDYRSCDQLCRRLGFPGGVCEGDKCKCDNFAPITAELETDTSLRGRQRSDDDDYKADYSLRSGCNFRACDQLCRRLGFPGGACVGDKCECDNFKPHTVEAEFEADTSLRGGCNLRACEQLCRRLGFPGGVCIEDKCKCDNFSPFIITADLEAENSIRGDCDLRACEQLCRRLGFPGGACVGDKCQCDNFKHVVTKAKLETDTPLRGGCNLRACEQLCRRLGFPGGACVGDTCKCDNFEPLTVKGTVLDYLLRSRGEHKVSNSLQECDYKACNKMCRYQRFSGGTCIGDRCDCGPEEDNNEYIAVNDDQTKNYEDK